MLLEACSTWDLGMAKGMPPEVCRKTRRILIGHALYVGEHGISVTVDWLVNRHCLQVVRGRSPGHYITTLPCTALKLSGSIP